MYDFVDVIRFIVMKPKNYFPYNVNKLLIFTLLLVMSMAAAAQAVRISGTVVDAESRQPIPYAYLRIEGTASGTQTNLDGAYSLSLQRDKRVIVSSMGYRSDTIEMAKLRKQPTVRLAPSPVKLSSVSVTEYTKPSSLLSEVVRRIPDNYWTDTTVGTFFHRSYGLTSDSLWLFVEGVAEVMRPGYDKQYYKKLGLIIVDVDGNLDSIRHAGNHKRFVRSRLLVFDTAMLRDMLGDTVYETSPFVGRSQTVYTEKSMFGDLLQQTQGNAFLNMKRNKKMDKKARLSSYEDADGNAYYVVTSVASNDSTAIVVNRADLALLHYYHTSLHPDTIILPFPLNKVMRGIIIPYQYTQYDYAKIDGRYTLVFCHSAHAYSLIEPKKALVGRKINKAIRKVTTDDVVENYTLWSLISLQPGDHRFLDTAATIPIKADEPFSKIFSAGDNDTAFWRDYDVIPIEERIAVKLREAERK